MPHELTRYDQKLEHILRTSARIFAEKSYHSTSMRDISRATGVSLAGLYHYTTQTSQAKETTSVVDIGYHYVAVDANGNPIDTDVDGVPDYMEDRNGNGSVDSGETDWQSATDIGLKVWITEPKSNSNIP